MHIYSFHFRFFSAFEEKIIDVWRTITTSNKDAIGEALWALSTGFWYGMSEASVNDIVEWEEVR